MSDDKFDRRISALQGLPGVLKTKPTTIQTVSPLAGGAAAYIVQTYRMKNDQEKYHYTTFLQVADSSGLARIVIPDKVISAIVEQRVSLQVKGRRLTGKENMAARMAAGFVPTPPKRKKGKGGKR